PPSDGRRHAPLPRRDRRAGLLRGRAARSAADARRRSPVAPASEPEPWPRGPPTIAVPRRSRAHRCPPSSRLPDVHRADGGERAMRLVRKIVHATLASWILAVGPALAADVLLGDDPAAKDKVSIAIDERNPDPNRHTLRFVARDTGLVFTPGGGV